ncbi:WD-40 repeat protein [Reticulomyxa filosa]|uniref:WD-40 repeat protein n=1 Tax=Reticulomyxa filosa TaxID=46433 RepID=X6PDR3_RETFI|nr:WD-40 repeat protein [Reticulomyxa filosa]|eukprot:ETO35807.1 WD-40 repeat protein [Reticulomyxa filosa]
MSTQTKKKQTSTLLEFVKDIQIIIQYWIRIFNIKLGWINNFDMLVFNYVMFSFFYLMINMYLLVVHYVIQANTFIMLDMFFQSSKLLKTLCGHTNWVNSIDYSTFDDCQFICSGSDDHTVRVWNLDVNKQIQIFSRHSNQVNCVKFSQYHCHNYHRNIVCSSSDDRTIRFWDIKNDRQLQIYNEHTSYVKCIEFSSFNCGQYLCSGSLDKKIRLWDIETSKSLHVFNGHTKGICCVDVSPLQSNVNNKSNSIGVIGGNGYTICSGSNDATIRIWDIETTKQLIILKGHECSLSSVKYGSNELVNTILSGSYDSSVRLWDIRSGQQIQVFNGHIDDVYDVEYSPFAVVNNIEFDNISNVICSGSFDNTIRFWDIRSNKKELHLIKGDSEGDNEGDDGILCLKFLQLKKSKSKYDSGCGINLCYGSCSGNVYIWG